MKEKLADSFVYVGSRKLLSSTVMQFLVSDWQARTYAAHKQAHPSTNSPFDPLKSGANGGHEENPQQAVGYPVQLSRLFPQSVESQLSR
jgi:hypothetical protein